MGMIWLGYILYMFLLYDLNLYLCICIVICAVLLTIRLN